MFKIQVHLNGLDTLLLERTGGLITQRGKNLVADLTQIANKWVKRDAPRKTGRLKNRGTQRSLVGNTKGWVWVSKVAVPYAWYVIDGTRPHTIRPKRKQALFWKGASHPIKRVKHPGTKGNPFVDRAFDDMMPEIEKKIGIFERWIGRL